MPDLRILLADDHAIVREGLKRLIEAQPGMSVVGEAESGAEAIQKATELCPDIAVLDISMGEVNGARATRDIRQLCPNTKVIALTVHEDKSYLHELLEAGASGYILKRAASDELVHAIGIVAGGGIYVDPRVAGKLIPVAPFNGARGESYADLSARETEVMRLIAQGFSNKEISVQLGVSVKTIETYKARSMEKLGLRSRVDIVRMATKRGWLTTT
jgi:DNA-binding NarL/FixJ family response regulator